MNARKDDIGVTHNVAGLRFEIEVDGQLAFASYEQGEGKVVLTHTFVPPELRGRGLAEKLARAALDHARAEAWRVVPACSYMDRFIQRHAEYQPLVA